MKNRSMFTYVTVLTLLYCGTAFAAGGGHGSSDHGVPWKTIAFQCLNFFILVGALGYLLKRKLKDHFAARKSQYHELISKADKARAEAETNRREIATRLARLESEADKSVQQAQSEAAELKQRIIREAEELSKQLEVEAKRTIAFEIERAKAELRGGLLQDALEQARKSMSANVGESDQRRLQSEFVDKIQVVR